MSEPAAPRRRARPGPGPAAQERRTGERLVALLLAGGALLNFPLLSVLRDSGLVAGVPALYVWLFSVWALLVAATALILRARPPARDAGDDEPPQREP